MKNMMKSKSYYGSVHYSDEDRIFHGKIEFIRSLVNYEGSDVENLRRAFQEAVEDYLDLCQQEGIEPEQSFRGSFNVRTGSELHQKAALYAKARGGSLNNLVADALEQYLSSEKMPA